jgi:hypothetical protein
MQHTSCCMGEHPQSHLSNFTGTLQADWLCWL